MSSFEMMETTIEKTFMRVICSFAPVLSSFPPFSSCSTERLANSGARFETLHLSRNGAICNVEQIKADRSVSANGRSSALVVNQSVMRERNLQLMQEVCQMRSGFVQGSVSQCSKLRAIFHVWGPDLFTS